MAIGRLFLIPSPCPVMTERLADRSTNTGLQAAAAPNMTGTQLHCRASGASALQLAVNVLHVRAGAPSASLHFTDAAWESLDPDCWALVQAHLDSFSHNRRTCTAACAEGMHGAGPAYCDLQP